MGGHLWKTYIALGQVYQQQHDLEAAIQAYQKAIFYGAKEGTLWVTIGDLFSERSQWSAATVSYRTALLQIAHDPQIFYKLGNSLGHTGQYAQAIDAYQKAVALQPALTAAHLAMGNAFAVDQAFEQAIACYTTVITQDDKNEEAYKNLATIFALQGNDAGLTLCNQRLGLPSAATDNNQATDNTQTENSTDRSTASSTVFSTAFETVSASAAETAQVMEQAIAHQPVVPDDELARLYQAVDLNPNSASCTVQLADALAQQGLVNQAIAFYKIALKLAPEDFQIALRLRKHLDALAAGSALHMPGSDSSGVDSSAPEPLGSESSLGLSLSRAVTLPAATRISPLCAKPGLPGFPPDFAFPPIVGEHNDYTFIHQRRQTWLESAPTYSLPVSIIIPTYNRKDKLAKLLAALTHQTYPQSLIEVIIADDGSSDGVDAVIEKYQSQLNLVHAYQEDQGFRLAAVCNLGMQAATHPYFIFLQCDMIPTPQLVEAYMQYFHVADNVFLIGGRQFVCADTITDDQILTDVDVALNLPPIKTNNKMWTGRKSWQDWRIPLYEQTDDLKQARYPYHAVVGSNLAFPRTLLEDIGGFSEDFHDWGGEDREYGYRAYNAGYYFIPVSGAQCLHQEPPDGVNETDRLKGHKVAQAGCEAKCPLLPERISQPGRCYEVPKVSLFMIDGFALDNEQKLCDLQAVQDTIESALTQTQTDLEICIVCGDRSEVVQQLKPHYLNDRRVRCCMHHSDTLGEAYQAAITLCRGAYVGPLMPGDVLKPTAVETLVRYLDNKRVGCVYGNYQVMDSRGRYRMGVAPPESSRSALTAGLLRSRFCLFRMRDWRKTAGLLKPFNYATRYDLTLKLAEVCSFAFVDQLLSVMTARCQRLSAEQRQKQALEMAEAASYFVMCKTAELGLRANTQ